MTTTTGPVPLTADLCARAIIAAARAYGDDAERAFIAKGGPKRRSLTPAADALSQATGLPFRHIAPILGIAPRGCARARDNGGDAYRLALTAAERAVRYAGWKPEARASVVEPPRKPAGPVNGVRRLTARAAQREIEEVLVGGPMTCPDLVTALRLDEGQVREALIALIEAGRLERVWGAAGTLTEFRIAA